MLESVEIEWSEGNATAVTAAAIDEGAARTTNAGQRRVVA